MTINPYRSAAQQAAADAKHRRPRRVLVALAAVAALVICGGVGVLAWMQAARHPAAAATSEVNHAPAASSVTPSPFEMPAADGTPPGDEPVAPVAPAVTVTRQEAAPPVAQQATQQAAPPVAQQAAPPRQQAAQGGGNHFVQGSLSGSSSGSTISATASVASDAATAQVTISCSGAGSRSGSTSGNGSFTATFGGVGGGGHTCTATISTSSGTISTNPFTLTI